MTSSRLDEREVLLWIAIIAAVGALLVYLRHLRGKYPGSGAYNARV